jgi:glycosyltransferase involved in cell wall biosynthesis
MRILMVAPEPFFEPRGTPFSVYQRARALGKLGHQVDLVTYPIGAPIALEGVTLHRAWRVPFVKQVKIGPSLAKLPLDAMVFARTVSMLVRRRYDCLHTHEEAGIFGAILSRVFRVPHVYDMHSDLAQQMSNFQVSRSRLLVRAMRALERVAIRSADVVIVICAELEQTVADLAPGKRAVLIENSAGATGDDEVRGGSDADGTIRRLRAELDIPADAGPVVVYTGTFELYQGLDLVVKSIPLVRERFPGIVYVLAGGRPDQIATLARLAEKVGASGSLRLPGQRPASEMPLLMELADILISPRSSGTNTPLKLYSYLHAGRPILATGIRSHTQVLTPDVALLVEPTVEGLGTGALRLLADRALGQRLAANAVGMAQERYSYSAFLARTSRVYDLVAAPAP